MGSGKMKKLENKAQGEGGGKPKIPQRECLWPEAGADGSGS